MKAKKSRSSAKTGANPVMKSGSRARQQKGREAKASLVNEAKTPSAKPTCPAVDAEASDWYARYEALIADYERMAEKRRERKLLRLARAKRDNALRTEYEETQEWLRTHPCHEILPDMLNFQYKKLMTVVGALLSLSILVGNVVGISLVLRFARKGVSKCINRIECRLMRHANYEAVAHPSRRSAAEIERRKIHRRMTKNPESRANDVRRAWLNANESCESIISFGALIHDLECYVDNGLNITDDGIIVGRRAGIRGWINENVPELSKRYKTIMRYKAIAKRCRQFLGLRDPTPLDPREPRLRKLLHGCPATQKDLLARLDSALMQMEQEAATKKSTASTNASHRRKA